MSAGILGWLLTATFVFMAANAVLKVYAVQGGLWVLAAALALFCVGNILMVRVMRENGLGLAISLSAVLQLVAISLMAVVLFGERPSGMQIAGMALGVVAVGLIAWPRGG